MSERNFWLLLKGALGMQMHRIENKMASGTPDIHFIHKGISCFDVNSRCLIIHLIT